MNRKKRMDVWDGFLIGWFAAWLFVVSFFLLVWLITKA